MSLEKSLQISFAGLNAQSTRLRVIADGLVEHALEGDDLAPVGLAARRRRSRLGIRHVLGDDAKPRALRVQPGEGDLQRFLEAHGSALAQPVGLRPSTSLIKPICWRSRLVVSA